MLHDFSLPTKKERDILKMWDEGKCISNIASFLNIPLEKVKECLRDNGELEE